MEFRLVLTLALLLLGLVDAHTVIVYPGYRGNNLITNGTIEEANGLGAASQNGSMIYPYGMEWIYPCTSYTNDISTCMLLLTLDRRRNAHLYQPHKMAHPRRCYLPPTGLVPRPLLGLYVHEHGLRYCPSQHEQRHDQAVCLRGT